MSEARETGWDIPQYQTNAAPWPDYYSALGRFVQMFGIVLPRCRDEYSWGRGRARRASAAYVRLPCPLQRRRFRRRDRDDLSPVFENGPAGEHLVCVRADGDRDDSCSSSFAVRLAFGEDASDCRATRDRSPARGLGLRDVPRRRRDSRLERLARQRERARKRGARRTWLLDVRNRNDSGTA